MVFPRRIGGSSEVTGDCSTDAGGFVPQWTELYVTPTGLGSLGLLERGTPKLGLADFGEGTFFRYEGRAEHSSWWMDCEDMATWTGYLPELISYWRHARHHTGTEQNLTGDFDGDGRTDLLRVQIRKDTANPSHYVTLAQYRRAPAANGEHGLPQLDTLIRVTNGMGAISEISYLPRTDQRVSPDVRDWNDRLLDDPDGCIAGDGPCDATLAAGRQSLVWRTVEEKNGADPGDELVTAFTYEGALRDRVTNQSLGFSTVTRRATRGSSLVSYEVREFANETRGDVPVASAGAAPMIANRALLAGRPKRVTRVTERATTGWPNERTRYVSTQTEFAYTQKRTMDVGTFEAPHIIVQAAAESRTSEFELHASESSPERWYAEASDPSQPNSRTSLSRLCNVGPIPEAGALVGDGGSLDDYGNTLCTFSSDSSGVWSQRETEYLDNEETERHWQVGLVERVTTTTANAGDAEDQWKVRKFRYRYCPEGVGYGWSECTIEQGVPLVTYDDDGHPDYQVRREYTYTEHGQVETVISSTPHESNTQTGKFETIYYDGHDHTFPRQIIRGGGIAEPLQWDQAYDPRFGKVNVNIDPKGQVQTMSYDGMGRTVHVDAGDGTEVTTYYEPVLNWPMRVRSVSPGLGERTTRFDRLGRLVNEQWRSFQGEWRSRQYDYDRFNNLSGVSLPQYGPASVGAPWWAYTRYETNAMGERQLEVHPNGRTIVYEQRLEDGYGVSRVNDEGIETHTIADDAGRIIARIDGNDNQRCYAYDALGQIKSTWMIAEGAGSSVAPCGSRPVVGGVTHMAYDERGQLLDQLDPELGQRTYTYNGYGEVLSAGYPANAPAPEGTMLEDTFQYDALGRMIRQFRPEGESRYWFDLYTPGELGAITSGHGADTFMHDAAGRIVWENHQYAHEGYVSHVYDYDFDPTTGLLETLTMPQAGTTGVRPRIGYRYDAYGTMEEIVEENASGMPISQLWELWSVNEFEQPEYELRSDGELVTGRFYDPDTGAMTDAITYDYWYTYQQMTVVRDVRSMVTDRYDWVTWQHEAFGFDDADRLETQYVGSMWTGQGLTRDFTYDQFGNMTYRGGLGTLTYEQRGTNPRALTQMGSMTIDYDRRGNQVRRGSTNLAYSSFDKPVSVQSANDSVYFTYGPGTERIRRLSGVEDRTYAGGLYERIEDTSQGVTKHHYRVPGASGVATEITIEEGFGSGNKTYTYVAPDELGSSTVVLEKAANGWLQGAERISYGPWGRRRNAWDWRYRDSGNSSETTIGYTGHAEQETAELIYMNARMYDPLSGRFVSADPIVPNPFETDGWSRYVYVGNNPVGYTDPSGHAPADAPGVVTDETASLGGGTSTINFVRERDILVITPSGTANTEPTPPAELEQSASVPESGSKLGAQEPGSTGPGVAVPREELGPSGMASTLNVINDQETYLAAREQQQTGSGAATDAGGSGGTGLSQAQQLQKLYGGKRYTGRDSRFDYAQELNDSGHLDAASAVGKGYHSGVMGVGEEIAGGIALKALIRIARAFRTARTATMAGGGRQAKIGDGAGGGGRGGARPGGDSGGRPFNDEQRALVDMAKRDKRTGITRGDAQAYRELADEVGLPARGPEVHPNRPFGQEPHMHVGPVNHIPVID